MSKVDCIDPLPGAQYEQLPLDVVAGRLELTAPQMGIYKLVRIR